MKRYRKKNPKSTLEHNSEVIILKADKIEAELEMIKSAVFRSGAQVLSLAEKIEQIEKKFNSAIRS